MRRDIAKPLHAGSLHLRLRLQAGRPRRIRRQPLRHCAGNQRRPLLLQPLDQRSLLLYERVDLRCFSVQKIHNGALFFIRRQRNFNRSDFACVHRRVTHSHRTGDNRFDKTRFTQRIREERWIRRAWSDDGETGRDDRIGLRLLNVRNCLQIGSHCRDDGISITNDSPRSARSTFEGHPFHVHDPVNGIYASNIDIRHFKGRISRFRQRLIVDASQVFESFHFPMRRQVPQPFHAARLVFRIRRQLHDVTSPSSVTISASSCLMSVSITSSGRGGS